jgi:predicted Rossmann fold nucleotide-binding protein DprA/Smf involved in DNA uptake
MKNVQKELVAISASLSSLVKQMEKMAEAIEKEGGKAAPKKKAKPGAKAKAPVKKGIASAKKTKAAPKKKAPKKKAPKKKAPKKKAPKKKAPKKKAPAAAKAKAPAAAGGQTMLDKIFGMISRSRKGITVERLKKRVGLEARQVSNALYKLTKKGKIETLSRGVYVKKKK